MIPDGRYTVFSFVVKDGRTGGASADMIVEGGKAKVVLEWIGDAALIWLPLDQSLLKKTTPGSMFQTDYVYEGQINLDSQERN